MINQSNISDWIERYLDLELNDEQELMFHRSLEENPDWNEELRQEQLLRKAIAVYNVNRIKKQVRADMDSGKAYQVSDIPWKYIFTIVGVLAIISYLGYSVVTLEYQKEKEQPTKKPQKEDSKKVSIDTVSQTVSIDTFKVKQKKVSKANKEITNESVKSILAQLSQKVDTAFEDSANSLTDTSSVISAKPEIKQVVDTVQKKMNSSDSPESRSKSSKPYDCSTTSIAFEVETDATCPGNNDGAVRVFSLEGGQKPYSKKLLNIYKEEIPFTFLGAGQYKVIISDKNGCATSKEITVAEKQCDKPLELLFRPSLESNIEIPIENESGRIEIIDQGNSSIWSKDFRFGAQYVEWNGTDRYGKKVSNGVYAIMIRYDNGVIKNGYITVY